MSGYAQRFTATGLRGEAMQKRCSAIFGRLFALCVVVLFLAPWTGAQAGWFSGDDTEQLKDYKGADAGRLVVSLGAYRGADYAFYRLFFHTHDKSKMAQVKYTANQPFLPQRYTDYSDGIEAGDVAVWALAPGEYEFYNFEIYYAGGMVQETFRSKEDFSIPFTIKPGKTVYLGEFRAMEIYVRNLFGLEVPGGAKFQIFDEHARDMPIAKVRDPLVGEPEILLPDPAAIKSPFFQRLP
jgi:hypothetical protein